ncbi:hypothetical protein GALL_330510 [mine drainage metagenome]|uniref:Uncharacterized protein n=1 Tax=mine drainage metagenome TaxID=410659 RepID=A0A1J5R5W8_9ZZZZ
MKTWTLLLCSCVLTHSIFAQNANNFEHFTAPGVTGAFYAPWDPLGPTDKGYVFSIGFFLAGKDETTPLIMWIPKSGNRSPIEVKSLAAINAIARQITAGQSPEAARNITIQIVCRLVSNTMVNMGSGGFILDPNGENKPQSIITRLRKAGLSESDAAMLNGLVEQARFTIGNKQWARSFFEVDSLGSVEKITLTGTVNPPSVKSLQVEAVFDAGRIGVEILKRERRLQMEYSK